MADAIKTRKDFPTGAEGDAQFQAYQKEQTAVSKVAENPAPKDKRKARLLAVSEEIVINRPDASGASVERKFFNLELAGNTGEPWTLAVNSEFAKRILPRLREGRPYEWELEMRKADVTTYKDSNGKVTKHTSTGEQLVNFKLITERAFDEGTDGDIERIVQSGESAGAVADYLKTVRTASLGK